MLSIADVFIEHVLLAHAVRSRFRQGDQSFRLGSRQRKSQFSETLHMQIRKVKRGDSGGVEITRPGDFGKSGNKGVGGGHRGLGKVWILARRWSKSAFLTADALGGQFDPAH